MEHSRRHGAVAGGNGMIVRHNSEVETVLRVTTRMNCLAHTLVGMGLHLHTSVSKKGIIIGSKKKRRHHWSGHSWTKHTSVVQGQGRHARLECLQALRKMGTGLHLEKGHHRRVKKKKSRIIRDWQRGTRERTQAALFGCCSCLFWQTCHRWS